MSYLQCVRPPLPGAGVFLAVAAYDGLAAPFVMSLFSSALSVGRNMGLEIFAGNCHVDDSRNRLVRDFLESDCDQIVFLDTDVGWSDGDLRRLIDYKADIVAGIYPMKTDDDIEYPVKTLPGERWSNAEGLVEVEGVPTGFLKIRRHVLETLAAGVPSHFGRGESPGDRQRIPLIFERTLNGDSRRGGDYEFCRKAREAGFKVYVDPRMQLSHQGTKVWNGCLGHFWRKDIAVPMGLRQIREGSDTPETYLEMYNAWGNEWAMSPEALFTTVRLARQAKVGETLVDCGSGLSTLCMAAARPDLDVVAYESSAVWASKIEGMARAHDLENITIHVREIREYGDYSWYDIVHSDDSVIGLAGLIVCDGPPRKTGRMGLFRRFMPTCPVLVDDVLHGEYRRDLEAYATKMGMTLSTFDSQKQTFGVMV